MIQLLNKRFLSSSITIILLGSLTFMFLYAEVTNDIRLSDTTLPFILPLLAVLYLIRGKKKNFYFLMFVVLYTLSQVTYAWVNLSMELVYFMSVSLNILAFTFLIIDVFERLRKRYGLIRIFQKSKCLILSLVVLNVFLYKVLLSHLHLYHSMPEIMIVSVFYSIATLMLFSVSTVNLFMNRDRKSFWFFLASLFVVLADVIQIFYYSNRTVSVLGIVYSSVHLVTFYLFYQQAIVASLDSK